MAAKAWGSQPNRLEEVFVRNEAVSLCLVVHRRTRTMRVIDFRAGPTPARRQAVLEVARREGIEKVFTLVEREEVATWMKVGFAREGTIPGFYKRSDAWLLGCPVRETAPLESVTRLPVRGRATVAEASCDDGLGDDAPFDASQAQADRTVLRAKKRARALSDAPPPRLTLAPAPELDARRAVDKALRAGAALTAFEPFGRGAERRYFQVIARLPKGATCELWASTESQSCFGNTFLELLRAPRTEGELAATTAGLKALCARLLTEGAVSGFSLAPADDGPLSAAFVASGFRRTGLLKGHMVVGGERKDAIVWSRKLAGTTDD